MGCIRAGLSSEPKARLVPPFTFGRFVHQFKEVETIMNASILQLILPAWTKQVRLLCGSASVLLALALPGLAQADTLVKFTFENSMRTTNEGAGIWFTNIPAEWGTGTASARHQAACVYTS